MGVMDLLGNPEELAHLDNKEFKDCMDHQE